MRLSASYFSVLNCDKATLQPASHRGTTSSVYGSWNYHLVDRVHHWQRLPGRSGESESCVQHTCRAFARDLRGAFVSQR